MMFSVGRLYLCDPNEYKGWNILGRSTPPFPDTNLMHNISLTGAPLETKLAPTRDIGLAGAVNQSMKILTGGKVASIVDFRRPNA